MEKKMESVDVLMSILKECKNEKDYNGKKRGVRLTFTNLKASQSGMSRTFNIYATTKNGTMQNITYLVSKITGNTYTQDGKMRIYGCGMDMLFETCYQLNCSIWRAKGHKKYNHEKAYHGYVDTFYNLI